MKRYFRISALSFLLSVAGASATFGAAGAVRPEDTKAVVGLIKYLYAGYDNGANDRKSFVETVPWDPEMGRLMERIEQCERKVGEIIDFDWPSDSQDPHIKNLSVVSAGSTSPKDVTVLASFRSYNAKVTIKYEFHLYDEAPLPRRWGVSNIRIRDDRGASDLLETVNQALKGDCKGF